MTMLTIIQNHCRRTNITVPTTVAGSTDPQVLQLQALLEEEGIALADRGDWQELTFEATHTTLAQEDQGAIDTIASNGFDHFKQDTFWDRTLRLPIVVLDGQEWAASKAIANTGPTYQARVRGSRLISTPVPSAGNTWAFEYVSRNWVLGADGVTYKQFLTLDTDAPLLPEKILIAGLRWRWKKEKGLDYSEDFSDYEHMVSKALGHNGLKKRMNMGDEYSGPRPAVMVPQGNWSLP